MLRWIVLGLAAASLLFVADLAWSGWTAYEGLRTAKADLQAGGDGLVAGELSQAEGAFQRAADAGDAALRRSVIPRWVCWGSCRGSATTSGPGGIVRSCRAAGHGGVVPWKPLDGRVTNTPCRGLGWMAGSTPR